MLFQFALLATGLQIAAASNVRQSVCSNENTGKDFAAVTNVYNSISACNEVCGAKYKYAILQDAVCWCSNDGPSAQSDISECSTPCPGYPADSCGNKDQKLYTYISSGFTPETQSSNSGNATTTSASSSASSSLTVNWNNTASGNATAGAGGKSGSESGSNSSSGSNSTKNHDQSSGAAQSMSLSMASTVLGLGAVAALIL